MLALAHEAKRIRLFALALIVEVALAARQSDKLSAREPQAIPEALLA